MAALPVILAAVDGSEQSMYCVTYLSRLLSPEHVRIELHHVLARLPESFLDQAEEQEADLYNKEIGEWKKSHHVEIHRFIEETKKRFLAAGFPSQHISVSVVPSKVGIARDIINKSLAGYAALVVGRRGGGNLPEYMLGSIVAKLSDTITHIPLCVVGGQPEARKVVVAFDRSKGLREGIDRVSALFNRNLDEILLCHVVRQLSEIHPATYYKFTSAKEAYWLDEGSRKIIPDMVETKQRLAKAGFDQGIFRTIISKERVSRASGIYKQAEMSRAGTIISGRRGSTSIELFSMGRVTRKILHMAYNQAVWIV